MPDVTIASTATQLKWQGGSAPTFIIEAAGPTLTPEGVPVNNGGGPFRNEWATSVNGSGYVVVPSVSLPSGVSYVAYFQKANTYDPGSKMPFSVFGPQQPFYVPDDTPTTWEEIDTARGGSLPAVSGDRTVNGNLHVTEGLQVDGPITSDDTLNVNDDVNVTGAVNATQFAGDGSLLTGVTPVGGSGGSSSTGSHTFWADSDDNDPAAIADTKVGAVTVARAHRDYFRTFKPLRLPGYATGSLPAAGNAGQLAYDTDRARVVFDDGVEHRALGESLFINVKEHGLAGDGSTDDTAAFQALLDLIDTLGLDATLFFPVGTYIIDGALQDTSASNSQLVLPKRNTLADQLTLRLLGEVPAPTFGRGNAGAIIESTLASGTGSIVGVKNLSSTGGIASIVTGANFLVLHVENLTFRAVDNPTISGLDLRYLPNISCSNVKIDVNYAGALPSEPTTATSYGIKTPLNNIACCAALNNVQVTGFYYSGQWNELASGHNVTANFCVYVAEIPHALHALHFGRVLRTECIHGLHFTGGNSVITIEQFDIDNNETGSAWYDFVDHITDPNNYAHGVVNWHTLTQDVGPEQVFIQDGGFYLWTPRIMQEAVGHDASPLIRVFRNATLSVPNDTLTNVGFNVKLSSDYYAMHSTVTNNHRLVCTKEGIAHLDFSAVFEANGTGLRQVRVYKHSNSDGEVLLRNVNVLPVTGFPTSVNVRLIVEGIEPGDYFYMQVWQNSGSTLTLLTADFYSPTATLHIVR